MRYAQAPAPPATSNFIIIFRSKTFGRPAIMQHAWTFIAISEFYDTEIIFMCLSKCCILEFTLVHFIPHENNLASSFTFWQRPDVHHMQINHNVDREILQRNPAQQAVQHACSMRLTVEVHISLNKLLQWSISSYRNGNMEEDVQCSSQATSNKCYAYETSHINSTYRRMHKTWKDKRHKAHKPTCLVLWDSQNLICVTELEIFSFLWSLVSSGSMHTERVNGRAESCGKINPFMNRLDTLL